MAITAETRGDIIELYVAMFNAAPGVAKLSELVTMVDVGKKTLVQLANDLAATSDFTRLYPVFQTNSEFATRFINNILPEVSAAGKTEAIAVVTGLLNGGTTRGAVVWEASKYLSTLSETDANFGVGAANFNNKVEIATYHTVTKEQKTGTLAEQQAVLAAVNSTQASVDAAKAAVDVTSQPVGNTYTLTTSATDVINGTAGNDTIIGQLGQSVTLQASDTINGGAGTDTLRVVTDGAGAQAATGFTAVGVEVLEVQAQAVGGTTLSLENVTGVSTIRSSSSSGALTLDQVKAIANIEVNGALGTQPLTVNYQAAAVAGTNTQNIALNGNALGTLTINGVETMAIAAGNANSTVASIVGSTFSTLNVSGDKTLTVTAALPNTVKTVDASAQTAGGISVTVGTADVAVKGGAGADTVTFTGTLTSADSYDGGAGTDTIIANQADYTANSYAAAAKISNVEVIRIADALTANFDASKIAGENHYRLDSGYTGPVTISKADDNSTIEVRAASTGVLTYSIDKATDTGTANTVNIRVGGTNGVAAGTIDVSGVETVNLTSNGSATTAGGNTLVITDAAATTLNISGAEDLMLTMTGTALTTVNASAATGPMDLSAVTYKAATSATITGGSGADKLTGSAAADTIDGGAGNDLIVGGGGADKLTGGAGIDTFAYNAVSDSFGSTQDTITDFVSGTDLIGLTTLANSVGRPTITLKNGAAADFGTAQSSVALNSGVTQVVFQVDTNTLWVDVNDDGTLNNNDLAIKLTGVTKIVQADVGGTGGGGNAVTLTAPAATVNKTTNTNASAVTTDFNDFITTTAANYAGSTIDGALGTDTLTISDAIGASNMATVSNVESVNLQAGSTAAFTANTTANLAITNASAAAVSTVVLGAATGQSFASNSTGVDTVTLGNASQSVSTGGGNDVINATVAQLVSSTINGGDGAGDVLNVTGAAGTINFNGTATNKTNLSGVETINVVGGSTVNITPDQALTIVTDGTAAATTVAATAGTGTLTVNHTAGAANLLTLSGSSVLAVTGSGTGGVTSTATGALTVTPANAAQTITSASATTVSAAALASALTLAGAAPSWTITGLGTVGGGTVNAGAGAGTLTVSLAGAGGATLVETTGTGAVTVNQASTGALTYTATASHTSHTINLTGTGAVNVQAGSTATSYTINVSGTAGARTYSNASTTSSVDTYTGGTGVDTVTLGLGADNFTSGGGADVFNLHLATDTGSAVGFNAGSAVPVQGQSVNVSGMDKITGFTAGATIVTGTTAAGIITNGGTLGANTTGNLAQLVGTYNAGTNTFTVDTGGTSTLLAFDSNGTTAGGSYVGVVLIGYVDTGAVDTWNGTWTATA